MSDFRVILGLEWCLEVYIVFFGGGIGVLVGFLGSRMYLDMSFRLRIICDRERLFEISVVIFVLK